MKTNTSVKFEDYNIIALAQAAAAVTEKLTELTGGNLCVVVLEDTANWHHKLGPAQRFPAETQKAGAYHQETKSRKLYRKVTDVKFDYQFASLWCEANVSFRLQGGNVIAVIPDRGYSRGHEFVMATVNTDIFAAEGVVMDGAICPKTEWTILSNSPAWEDLEGVSDIVLAMHG